MEDFDIYADLEVTKEVENKNEEELNKKISTLQQEYDSMKLELVKLKDTNKNLQTNLSSLIKTAKAEISRKDRTISELRSQLDNLAFRRNQRHNKHYSNTKPVPNLVFQQTLPKQFEIIKSVNFNIPPPTFISHPQVPHQNTHHKIEHSSINNSILQEMFCDSLDPVDKKDFNQENYSNASIKLKQKYRDDNDDDDEDDEDNIIKKSEYRSTVYGERLRSKLLEEKHQEEMKKKEEEIKNKTEIIDIVNNKENLSIINDKKNNNSIKIEKLLNVSQSSVKTDKMENKVSIKAGDNSVSDPKNISVISMSNSSNDFEFKDSKESGESFHNQTINSDDNLKKHSYSNLSEFKGFKKEDIEENKRKQQYYENLNRKSSRKYSILDNKYYSAKDSTDKSLYKSNKRSSDQAKNYYCDIESSKSHHSKHKHKHKNSTTKIKTPKKPKTPNKQRTPRKQKTPKKHVESRSVDTRSKVTSKTPKRKRRSNSEEEKINKRIKIDSKEVFSQLNKNKKEEKSETFTKRDKDEKHRTEIRHQYNFRNNTSKTKFSEEKFKNFKDTISKKNDTKRIMKHQFDMIVEIEKKEKSKGKNEVKKSNNNEKSSLLNEIQINDFTPLVTVKTSNIKECFKEKNPASASIDNKINILKNDTLCTTKSTSRLNKTLEEGEITDSEDEFYEDEASLKLLKIDTSRNTCVETIEEISRAVEQEPKLEIGSHHLSDVSTDYKKSTEINIKPENLSNNIDNIDKALKKKVQANLKNESSKDTKEYKIISDNKTCQGNSNEVIKQELKPETYSQNLTVQNFDNKKSEKENIIKIQTVEEETLLIKEEQKSNLSKPLHEDELENEKYNFIKVKQSPITIDAKLDSNSKCYLDLEEGEITPSEDKSQENDFNLKLLINQPENPASESIEEIQRAIEKELKQESNLKICLDKKSDSKNNETFKNTIGDNFTEKAKLEKFVNQGEVQETTGNIFKPRPDLYNESTKEKAQKLTLNENHCGDEESEKIERSCSNLNYNLQSTGNSTNFKAIISKKEILIDTQNKSLVDTSSKLLKNESTKSIFKEGTEVKKPLYRGMRRRRPVHLSNSPAPVIIDRTNLNKSK